MTRLNEGEILSLKKQGYRIYNAYFSSMDKILDSIVAAIRQRLGIEPLEYQANNCCLNDESTSIRFSGIGG